MANDALAQKAQNLTNRGRQALEARHYELAVEMLSQALDCAPDLLETRRLLRAAQIAKYRQNPPSGFALKIQGLSRLDHLLLQRGDGLVDVVTLGRLRGGGVFGLLRLGIDVDRLVDRAFDALRRDVVLLVIFQYNTSIQKVNHESTKKEDFSSSFDCID